MEKPLIILGIESSCDETACAITKDGILLSNVISSQIEVHRKYGGVMPEIASRLHLENVAVVIDEALKQANVTMDEVTAIAITRGPGLIGALHVGLQAAKTLSLIYNKPLIPVHHLTGHIYANEFIKPLKFPCLAVVVSGGNTELVYMKDIMFKHNGSDPVIIKVSTDGLSQKIITASNFWVQSSNDLVYELKTYFKDKIDINIKSLN